MYAGQANSPNTVLSGDVDSTTREITVDDASVLPAAPFLLTIGYDTSASETVLVTEKDGNTLTITRAVDGSAQVWVAGIKCARVFTAKDLNDLQTNVGTLLSNLNSVGTTTETLLADLADTYDAESVTGYAVGDYCIYSNTLYRCTTQIAAGGEAWTAAHWEEKPVGDVLKDQAEDIADLEEIAGNGVLSGFTATDLTGAANELKTDVGNLRGDLAYVENGNTASRNYTAGQYVCWKGILYTVNSGGISSGATFAVGTGSNQLTAVGDKGGLNDLKNSIPTRDEIVPVFTFSVPKSGSKTLTITSSPRNISFLIASTGGVGSGYGTLHFIGGYVSASRCTVTEIKGGSNFTIDASDTSGLNFVISNSATNVGVDVMITDLTGVCTFSVS